MPYHGAAAFAELPQLIPRDVLMGNPVKAAPEISPDGTHPSYLAPSATGILNVWVRRIGKQGEAHGARSFVVAFWRGISH